MAQTRIVHEMVSSEAPQPHAHPEGQQHPIKLYLWVWAWLFVLSTCSYLVDYFGLHGYLRWSLILLFMIVKAGEAWALARPLEIREQLGKLLMYVRALALYSGIDLMAEYRRKLAYNKTRPYRHGRKV